ncbi:N-acetyltransferase, partial [Streptomyces sp. T-3]|nr:N-acetyltransferase [Streptomyces sp. T-3]
MTEINIQDDRARGRIEARAGSEVVGHIDYFEQTEPARALAAVHTVVEPAHEGQGIAGSLARELYAL